VLLDGFDVDTGEQLWVVFDTQHLPPSGQRSVVCGTKSGGFFFASPFRGIQGAD
jgi:hypothetical protein